MHKGFADLSLTTWVRRQTLKSPGNVCLGSRERDTGFEPATSTLARSHSTTELVPRGTLIIHTECIAEKAEFGPGTGPDGDGEDIESIWRAVEMVACQICIGGADHALLFREADGVFGWFGELQSIRSRLHARFAGPWRERFRIGSDNEGTSGRRSPSTGQRLSRVTQRIARPWSARPVATP